jgi:hypothetical protein
MKGKQNAGSEVISMLKNENEVRLDKKTVKEIKSILIGECTAEVCVELNSGGIIFVHEDIIDKMFVNSVVPVHSLLTLRRVASEKEILQAAVMLLRRKALPLENLAKSIEKIYEEFK